MTRCTRSSRGTGSTRSRGVSTSGSKRKRSRGRRARAGVISPSRSAPHSRPQRPRASRRPPSEGSREAVNARKGSSCAARSGRIRDLWRSP
jgi:hypothetical protein